MKNITAVILAAGLGTRMKTDLPKVLHPVGSGTILGKVISSLKKAGVGDIIAVVGYKAELVESSFKDKVKFVRQEELLGSGDALKCALGAIKKDTTIVLVTCFEGRNGMRFHSRSQAGWFREGGTGVTPRC